MTNRSSINPAVAGGAPKDRPQWTAPMLAEVSVEDVTVAALDGAFDGADFS